MTLNNSLNGFAVTDFMACESAQDMEMTRLALRHSNMNASWARSLVFVFCFWNINSTTVFKSFAWFCLNAIKVWWRILANDTHFPPWGLFRRVLLFHWSGVIQHKMFSQLQKETVVIVNSNWGEVPDGYFGSVIVVRFWRQEGLSFHKLGLIHAATCSGHG